MKTMKHAMVLAVASTLTAGSYAQLNLGLSSATNATLRSAVNVASLNSTNAALNSATGSSVQAGTRFTGDIAATGHHLLSHTAVSLQSQTANGLQTSPGLRSSVLRDAGVQVNGEVGGSAQSGAAVNTMSEGDIQVRGGGSANASTGVQAGTDPSQGNQAALNLAGQSRQQTGASIHKAETAGTSATGRFKAATRHTLQSAAGQPSASTNTQVEAQAGSQASLSHP